MMRCSVLVFCSLLSVAMTFDFVKVEPKSQSVKEGETLEFWCNVDGWYEWCTFKHDDKLCDFQYDYETDKVFALNCSDYEGRYERVGSYNNYECGLVIKNAQPEDAGKWSCEMESYYSGKYRGYGYKAESSDFQVNVERKTTTTTTTTTTTEGLIGTKSNDYTDSSYNDYSKGGSNNSYSNETFPTGAERDHIIYVIVIVCIVAIIACTSLCAFLYRKSKSGSCFVFGKEKPVKTDEEEACVVDDEEAKHPTIVKNGVHADPEATTVTYKSEQGNEQETKNNEEGSNDEKKPLKEENE